MSEHPNHADPKPPSVDRLSQFWHRINDHKMVQWSVAYVAVAYAIQHGVTLTSEAFDWPHALVRVSMLLLVLGLPLVMTFAWYHGERASRRISGPELTIISILLVMSSLLFYVFVRPSADFAAPAAQQAGAAAARSAAASPKGAISLAVLPFVNLSSDKEQEFFSDGMTEEITAALAKVPDLRVVARTSAFEFKGKNLDVEKIGTQLHATHLIEGSVRKAGNRLRITAQLIKVDDGTHIWAEDYDRELTDVFAVQEDIARTIVTSLRVPLGLKQGESLVSNRGIDPESYQQFLLAKARLTNAVGVLEPIVGRYPEYAPAWAVLARAYSLVPAQTEVIRTSPLDEARQFVNSSLDKAEKAAREAVRLDPKYPGAFAALANVESVHGGWTEADDLFRQALALDPNDSGALESYSSMLGRAGRINDALRLKERLLALEPLVSAFKINTAGLLPVKGQTQAAIRMLEATPPDTNPYLRNSFLARAYAAEGRYREAGDALGAMGQQRQVSRRSVEDAARLLRSASAKTSAPNALPELEGDLSFVYGYIGVPDRVFDYPERRVAINYPNTNALIFLWEPVSAPLRRTERFKTLVRKAGLVDYWRARGWPDLCHPTTGDDFECN